MIVLVDRRHARSNPRLGCGVGVSIRDRRFLHLHFRCGDYGDAVDVTWLREKGEHGVMGNPDRC